MSCLVDVINTPWKKYKISDYPERGLAKKDLIRALVYDYLKKHSDVVFTPTNLAKRVGLSYFAVLDALKWLVEKGYVVSLKSSSGSLYFKFSGSLTSEGSTKEEQVS